MLGGVCHQVHVDVRRQLGEAGLLLILKLCVYVSVCGYVHVSLEEGIGAPELELEIVINFLLGCWELNWGPLREQYALLTMERLSLLAVA